VALLGYTLVALLVDDGFPGSSGSLGAGAIDAGLNTYVRLISARGLMQWLHAATASASTSGPLHHDRRLRTFQSWRRYLTVSSVQLCWQHALCSPLPMWMQDDRPSQAEKPKRLTDYGRHWAKTLRPAAVGLRPLLFFLYTVLR